MAKGRGNPINTTGGKFDLSNLTEREKDTLLTHFFHYIPQTDDAPAKGMSRRTIGEEYPGIYNRLYGRRIVNTGWPVSHERISAGLAAVTALREDAGNRRREESQRIFGHPGASIPDTHVTLYDEVSVALAAADKVTP